MSKRFDMVVMIVVSAVAILSYFVGVYHGKLMVVNDATTTVIEQGGKFKDIVLDHLNKGYEVEKTETKGDE
ncbi:hypothetical protein N9043_00595 [bacterium]|nr:hypothetical protein [bacterium]